MQNGIESINYEQTVNTQEDNEWAYGYRSALIDVDSECRKKLIKCIEDDMAEEVEGLWEALKIIRTLYDK